MTHEEHVSFATVTIEDILTAPSDLLERTDAFVTAVQKKMTVPGSCHEVFLETSAHHALTSLLCDGERNYQGTPEGFSYAVARSMAEAEYLASTQLGEDTRIVMTVALIPTTQSPGPVIETIDELTRKYHGVSEFRLDHDLPDYDSLIVYTYIDR